VIPLSERDQKVLEAIITDYIHTGEPVGSRTISRRYGLKVSSATIRNVMADLEEYGLLLQPHTSAGRVPTIKGLRFYLDCIMRVQELAKAEKALISKAYQQTSGNLTESLQQTCRLLSEVCNQVGVVFWPGLSATRFKRIEFIRLRAGQILVILISKSGLVQHNLIPWGEDISQDELDRYNAYVNDLLTDIPLKEVKNRILEEMRKEKFTFDQLFSRALEMAQKAFQSSLERSTVYIDGQINLLKHPEFADVRRMRHVLEAFEDKSRIIRLLDMTLNPASNFQITLGPEEEPKEMPLISIISSPYRRGDTVLGVLGVIGPLRMDYSRIVPVVEFTAELLSQRLEETD
jgi:heat-inducible transcriptional repressor